jgi:hypothetical protein
MNNPVPLGCPNPADLQARTGLAVAAKNVGNERDLPSEMDQQRRNVGKRKTPIHLLGLIPSESPIQQAKLFEAARLAGINEKYARQFLSVLIADRRILVRKIPRSKAKCALGFMRAPAQVESRYTAEELSPTS